MSPSQNSYPNGGEMTDKPVVYTRDQVIESATAYFNGNDFAAKVWTEKYALRNSAGEWLERTPDEMHLRLAREFARIEAKYPNPMSKERILDLIGGFRFVIPQGSPMFGIGNPHQLVSQSNCFVIDVVDSYGGICRADERIAQIAKRRGGVGLDVSPIRPRGLPTQNAAHTTDGVIVFMERFSRTCREVAQAGRRGALMMTISVHHPEIMGFIKCKSDLKRVTGANISVRVTDEFMKAVKENGQYELRWPVDSKTPSMRKMVSAKEVWDEIIVHAHSYAEPGVLFWDTIIRNSPADCYSKQGFATTSTNPCGELPLCPLDSCRLVAMNLTAYVDRPFVEGASFQNDLFREHVRAAQRILDDLIDIEVESVERIIAKVKSDPEPQDVKANELTMWETIRERCRQGRRTGLGITGLADAMAMTGVKYGSDESIQFVKRVYAMLRDESYTSSATMASERGRFPIYDRKVEHDHGFLSSLSKPVRKLIRRKGRRNIANLTTAPVGTVSNLTRLGNTKWFGVSSGGEPVYKATYVRRKKMSAEDPSKPDFVDDVGDRWKEFEIVHSGLSLYREVAKKDLKGSPYDGAQSEEINFVRRVEMQAAATHFVDHAISSTINLPANISVEKVGEIYMKAWELGCKGMTVYRQGSRDGVLIDKQSKPSKPSDATKNGDGGRSCNDCDEAAERLRDLVAAGKRPSRIVASSAPPRPVVMECDIHRASVSGKEWIFLVGKIEDMPYEVFGGESKDLEIPKKHKSGWILKDGRDQKEGRALYDLVVGDLEDSDEKMVVHNIAKTFNNYNHAPFGRLVSTALRHGVPIRWICEQITKDREDDFFSYNRAMARVLKRYVTDNEVSGLECPECHGAKMVYKSGCPTCLACGHSACS